MIYSYIQNMVDTSFFTVKSGRGGNGSASFRREKYAPKGGPNGGDGGDGGSVYIVADAHKNTLRDYAGKKKFAAQDGEPGGKQQKSGNKGADLELEVPVGTVIWEVEDESAFRKHDRSAMKRLGEILEPTDRLLIARGGEGGRGNVHFKSSVNQTPLEYEVGGEAQEKKIFLELKLLADVGFVGLPNAGKSTLLSVLTDARPKIANYPFTTLEPHLGVMSLGDTAGATRYVLADVPGLIEEASSGKGLGHQFLRHIERCRLLVYVLSPDESLAYASERSTAEISQNILKQWQTLRGELKAHNPNLLDRPVFIVVNKRDTLSAEELTAVLADIRQEIFQLPGVEGRVVATSAVTLEGIEELKTILHEILQQNETINTAVDSAADTIPVYTPESEVGKPTLTRKQVGNWRKL